MRSLALTLFAVGGVLAAPQRMTNGLTARSPQGWGGGGRGGGHAHGGPGGAPFKGIGDIASQAAQAITGSKSSGRGAVYPGDRNWGPNGGGYAGGTNQPFPQGGSQPASQWGSQSSQPGAYQSSSQGGYSGSGYSSSSPGFQPSYQNAPSYQNTPSSFSQGGFQSAPQAPYQGSSQFQPLSPASGNNRPQTIAQGLGNAAGRTISGIGKVLGDTLGMGAELVRSVTGTRTWRRRDLNLANAMKDAIAPVSARYGRQRSVQEATIMLNEGDTTGSSIDDVSQVLRQIVGITDNIVEAVTGQKNWDLTDTQEAAELKALIEQVNARFAQQAPDSRDDDEIEVVVIHH